MLALKFLVLGSFTLVFFPLYKVMSSGRLARNRPDRSAVVATHRGYANLAIALTIVALVLTEVYTRLSGGEVQNVPLLSVHIFCAMFFFVTLLVLRFRMDGRKNRRVHGPLAYACLGSYPIAYALGMVLLFQ